MRENKTFDEWKKLGYSVLKGEKAYSRKFDGTATFHLGQVIKYTPRRERQDYYDVCWWDIF